ncbi:hypothetical protein HMPREF3156_02655 [Neisseria sp. HMSC06F02]|nr:hypothetical protein HMPREF3156_02655 [Neisseria sp. HMSC06F02]
MDSDCQTANFAGVAHATTRRPDNLTPARPRLSDDLFFRYHNARYKHGQTP